MPEKINALERIFIRDLSCRCIIGTLPYERIKKQKISADIALYCDLKKACDSDKLDDTIDYISIEKNVVSLIENSSFYLVEKLADSIAKECLMNKIVKKVEVEIFKNKISRRFKTVSVKVSREQK